LPNKKKVVLGKDLWGRKCLGKEGTPEYLTVPAPRQRFSDLVNRLILTLNCKSRLIYQIVKISSCGSNLEACDMFLRDNYAVMVAIMIADKIVVMSVMCELLIIWIAIDPA